ncbi:MAG: hypothetical protein AAGI91_09255 [Bacteroidota bacterium]
MSTADLDALRARYLHLTREVLPAQAAEAGDWPVRYDHCFMRIVLDHVFGGRWYDHVEARPACRHLTGEQLRRAVDLAEEIAAEGAPLLRTMNQRSLAWRGKSQLRA